MEMNHVNPRRLRKFDHPNPVDTDDRGTKAHRCYVIVRSNTTLPEHRGHQHRSQLRYAEHGNPDEVRGDATPVVGRPQGTQNSSAGMGCSQKRTPAAERQGEAITRRIGHMTGPKGR